MRGFKFNTGLRSPVFLGTVKRWDRKPGPPDSFNRSFREKRDDFFLDCVLGKSIVGLGKRNGGGMTDRWRLNERYLKAVGDSVQNLFAVRDCFPCFVIKL